MKKNKLIEILTTIEGNPDIMLWNGLVGDFVDIGEIVESNLVKMTFDSYRKHIEYDEKKTRNDWGYSFSDQQVLELKSDYRKHIKWESNDYVTMEDIKAKRYSLKTIYAIDAKLKGETYFDRNGTMSY